MSKKEQSAKGPHAPNRMMLRRTLFLMIVCGIVAFIVLGLKLFQIQILKHDEYEAAAIDQQLRETTVPAQRGNIYDRNMNILALSISVSNIYISPAELAMDQEAIDEYNKACIEDGRSEDVKSINVADLVSRELAAILGLEYGKIYEKTQNTDSWYSTLATKVDDEVAEQVRLFKEEYELSGVKIEEATKRVYPYSSLACHVIGFVGADDNGLSGLEYYYDDILSGTDGRIVRATNAYGTDMLFTDFEDYYDAEDGQSIVLTVDETVQYYLEKHLLEAVEDYDLQDGAAGIVMDVNTGAILGMASLTNFDLNNYAQVGEEAQTQANNVLDEALKQAILEQARAEMWRNKALSDTYEPGSTYKIISLAMGLESGAININDNFYCGGHMEVLGRTDELNCWNTSGHGAQTLTEAIMNSCNIALVNIGQRVGAETFYEYSRAFGFFEKTGVDLTGESGSIWWSEDVFFDEYNLSQLAAASFGQTFTITPLQLITAVSAVANGGYLMEPYLVSQVLDAEGNVVSQREPEVVRQVISRQTSDICNQILEQVVSAGTGSNAYVPGYRVAGKTGTSEDVVYEAETGTKRYIVSFIGYAPADDPEVAVLVLLDNPGPESDTYTSGGQMAAPTVGAILADILPYLGVEPEYTEEEAAMVDRYVPRVTNRGVAEAISMVQEEGLTYRTVGNGATVTAQVPAANAEVAAGSEVILYCGGSPEEELVSMIDLTGLDYETARIRMGWSGLYIDGEGFANGAVYITKQSIPEGTLIPVGTVVEVTLSDSSNLGRY